MEQKTEHPNPTRPAFPTNARMYDAAQGLTKREYFAAMAMQGLLANPEFKFEEKYTADYAIKEADELLKLLSFLK
jgi:hypothetical protein